MAKPNSPCIFPKQRILEQLTKYMLTDTHINFTFHPWDQTLCVANSSWVLLCTPFLLLGKGQSSHIQQVQPNSLLRRTGTYQPTQTTSHLHGGYTTTRFIPTPEEMKREVNCPTLAWPFLTIYSPFFMFPSLQRK